MIKNYSVWVPFDSYQLVFTDNGNTVFKLMNNTQYLVSPSTIPSKKRESI